MNEMYGRLMDILGHMIDALVVGSLILWPLGIWKLCELLELAYWWLIQPKGL